MPKIGLELKCNLENVTDLQPAEREDFRWYLKLQCGNCGETSDAWHYVTLCEEHEIPGSRGRANYFAHCKLCHRQHSIDILPDQLKPYSVEKNNQFQQIIAFDCRGVEPVDFDPRVDWKVAATESNAVFGDVSLNEKEWCDYDEKANVSVGIYEVESRFEKIKR